jgi:hypothetical protein
MTETKEFNKCKHNNGFDFEIEAKTISFTCRQCKHTYTQLSQIKEEGFKAGQKNVETLRQTIKERIAFEEEQEKEITRLKQARQDALIETRDWIAENYADILVPNNEAKTVDNIYYHIEEALKKGEDGK